MARGAIVENPSPFTPPRVYLEQGWITAAGGGRCAPASPCAGAGGRTPPPLLPQPGENVTATLDFQRYEAPISWWALERGTGEVSGNVGLGAVGSWVSLPQQNSSC